MVFGRVLTCPMHQHAIGFLGSSATAREVDEALRVLQTAKN